MQTLKNEGGNPKPTANLTINKNRVKVYDNGTYYLKNGQTFEIELFNPTKAKVRADITIDGRLVTAGGLVLNPGERAYLERFVDTNNKFLFETYEVEDTDEVNEAISDNGRMKVEFYRESTLPWNNSGYQWKNYGFDPSKHPQYPHVTYLGNYTAPINPFYTSDFNVTTSTDGNDFTVTPANLTTTGNVGLGNSNPNDNLFFGTDSSVNAYYVNCGAEWNQADYVLTSSTVSTSETGRTEKGEASNQSFESVNASFDYLPFETVEYSLQPLSKKVITTKETSIQQYCTECGSKVKSKFKFCPKCGEKL